MDRMQKFRFRFRLLAGVNLSIVQERHNLRQKQGERERESLYNYLPEQMLGMRQNVDQKIHLLSFRVTATFCWSAATNAAAAAATFKVATKSKWTGKA